MIFTPDLAESKKKYYFCNELVEFKMTQYLWSGTTDVALRDSIMEHANELITQLIRKQRLYTIYNGHDPSSFSELVHVAYMQIERTIYKYRSRPHCRACFSYDRPNSSILYDPARFEFGIIKPKKLIGLVDTCPYCGADLKVGIDNIVNPQQGLYGGTDAILYRGLSKVFNMWCIAPDSMLITNYGMQEIGDIANEVGGFVDNVEYGNCHGQVFTSSGLNETIRYARRFNVQMVNVSTQFNYNIKSSLDHQFMVLVDSGIEKIKARDLKNGMLLGVQYNQQCFGNQDDIDFSTTINTNKTSWVVPGIWTEDLAYLVGLIISEGYIIGSDRGIGICNSEVGDFLESHPCGLRFKSIDGTIVFTNSSKVFCEFIKWLGIKSGAINKSIPKQILKCSKPILASFLRGLFDGDGHSKINNGTVGYTSTSKKLIDQLRVVLANFGILTKFTVDTRNLRALPAGSRVSKLLTAYQLSLSATDSRTFYSEIGFGIERKQRKSEKLSISGFKLLDRITSEKIKSLVRSISFTEFKRISGNADLRQNVMKKDRLTIETFDKLYKMFDEFKDDIFLSDRHAEYTGNNHKTIWVPVESITDGGLSETVDIEVPKTGSFIANCINVSNSQVSRTVILAYVKKDTRDTRNGDNYTIHINKKPDNNNNEQFVKALRQAREQIWFNDQYCSVVDSLIALSAESDADKNLKKKLSEMSGQDRRVIDDTLSILRVMMDLYSEEFDAEKLKCS
jgi:intein/homing endonuclease